MVNIQMKPLVQDFNHKESVQYYMKIDQIGRISEHNYCHKHGFWVTDRSLKWELMSEQVHPR